MDQDVHSQYEALSVELIDILEENLRDSVDASVCAECSGICCRQGGSGLFENVLLIYASYERGELKRDDYEFEAGLSLPSFIVRYFDVTFSPTANGAVVLFFTKTLTADNELVSWNSLSDYSANDPKALEQCGQSKGCVFLDGKIEGWPEEKGGASRGCILHKPEFCDSLTEKPIQCVLYNCIYPYELQQPDAELAAKWMAELAKCYPDSSDRFNDLMAKEIKGA